ncbi:MAG: hypothetical protein KKH06_04655 [Gammaproteobacteria bacterium]|nr:hypothetical protein [Gammaproteobacteria bacterium]MBU1629351.1 hypothetical protein [Gammaproteobacteria bacterium]MBU1926622.1 hypothetical protein [Gammaproteobacteria bacterium]
MSDKNKFQLNPFHLCIKLKITRSGFAWKASNFSHQWINDLLAIVRHAYAKKA